MRGSDVIAQAVKNRDEVTSSWGAAEEDMYSVMGVGGGGSWIEESVFS